MGWLLKHVAEILLIAGIFERLAKETPEDFILFGLKIGKYDNQLSDFVKMLIKSIFPGK